MRLTTAGQENAKVIARRLGIRGGHIALLFLILHGRMADFDGRLDEHGQAMLSALEDELLGPRDGPDRAAPSASHELATHVDGVTTQWRCKHGHDHPLLEDAALCRGVAPAQ